MYRLVAATGRRVNLFNALGNEILAFQSRLLIIELQREAVFKTESNNNFRWQKNHNADPAAADHIPLHHYMVVTVN